MNPFNRILEEDVKRANRIMSDSLEHRVELIKTVAGNLLDRSGKQLRLRLAILGAHMFAPERDDRGRSKFSSVGCSNDGLKLAAAVELIHNATLLHDDIIDKAKKRRNVAAAHRLWGERASVLVGDFLFARAFQLMVATNSLPALRCLSGASAEIVAGEVRQGAIIRNPAAPLELYYEVIDGKTGALFSAAMRAPALLATEDPAVQRNLDDFGVSFGRVFQMIDDLLDYRQPEGVSGKELLKDLAAGVVTLPVILAYELDPDFWREAFAADKPIKYAAKALDRINRVSLRQLKDVIFPEVEKARESMDRFPDTEAKEALKNVVESYLENLAALAEFQI